MFLRILLPIALISTLAPYLYSAPLKIAILGDIHHNNEGISTSPLFKGVVHNLKKEEVSHIIVTGDLVDRSIGGIKAKDVYIEYFKELAKALPNSSQTPPEKRIYFSIGNHDFVKVAKESECAHILSDFRKYTRIPENMGPRKGLLSYEFPVLLKSLEKHSSPDYSYICMPGLKNGSNFYSLYRKKVSRHSFGKQVKEKRNYHGYFNIGPYKFRLSHVPLHFRKNHVSTSPSKDTHFDISGDTHHREIDYFNHDSQNKRLWLKWKKSPTTRMLSETELSLGKNPIHLNPGSCGGDTTNKPEFSYIIIDDTQKTLRFLNAKDHSLISLYKFNLQSADVKPTP